MKKIVAFILCATLVLSMNLSVFAAPETLDAKNEILEKNVSVTYEETTGEPETVYHLSVEWSDLTAKYTEGKSVWNSEELKYEKEEGTWTALPQIKLTNYSNANIDVFLSYWSQNYKDINIEWAATSAYGADIGSGNGNIEIINDALISMLNINSESFEGKDGENPPTITINGVLSGDLTKAIEKYETTSGTKVDTSEAIIIGRVQIEIIL